MKKVVTLLVLVAALTVFAHDYIGVKKCKACHKKNDVYKVWEESKHAKAFETLKPEDQKKDECLVCHVTGFDVVKEADKDLLGVQCESCHGPAKEWKMLHLKKDEAKKKEAIEKGLVPKPDKKLCESCHNKKSPTFKGFNHEEAMKAIKHWK